MEGLSNDKRISSLVLQNWKYALMEQVDKKIGKYTLKIKSHKINLVFDYHGVKAELKRLQNDFVIVPIDKAANTIYISSVNCTMLMYFFLNLNMIKFYWISLIKTPMNMFIVHVLILSKIRLQNYLMRFTIL